MLVPMTKPSISIMPLGQNRTSTTCSSAVRPAEVMRMRLTTPKAPEVTAMASHSVCMASAQVPSPTRTEAERGQPGRRCSMKPCAITATSDSSRPTPMLLNSPMRKALRRSLASGSATSRISMRAVAGTMVM